MQVTEVLPIDREVEPADTQQLCATVQEASAAGRPLYPIGGGTSLLYGLPAKKPGTALHLRQLNRIIDYPARDMTITVEAGVTMQQLREQLASEGQFLPVDVPLEDRATLGGVIATNTNGPRRFGYGALRDYVIGIRAVDGRGTVYSGGGRVVKNVAGYDFCKLLTGSLGTLGIIHQVTLKLRPRPPHSAWVVTAPDNLQHAERLLESLALSAIRPTAVEWVVGPEWATLSPWSAFSEPVASDTGLLAVGLEGTAPEVAWQIEQLTDQWTGEQTSRCVQWQSELAAQAWQSLSEFPDHRSAALTLKVVTVPSFTGRVIAAAIEFDANCSIQSHAGSGITIVRMQEFPTTGLSKLLAGGIGQVAARGHGHVEVLANPEGAEMTPRMAWGGGDLPHDLLNTIRLQFDPQGILNPGRFVYHS